MHGLALASQSECQCFLTRQAARHAYNWPLEFTESSLYRAALLATFPRLPAMPH